MPSIRLVWLEHDIVESFRELTGVVTIHTLILGLLGFQKRRIVFLISGILFTTKLVWSSQKSTGSAGLPSTWSLPITSDLAH